MTATNRLPLPPTPDRVLGCYWTPNAAFIDELAAFLRGKAVLEIFAGNGYLAGMLAARGVAITATSVRSSHDAHEAGFYHPVEDLSAPDAVVTFGDAHQVLLMSWPTTTNAVLQAALLWGADRDIVFIGEMTDYAQGHLGGCATDAFFESIDVTHRFAAYCGRNALEHAVTCRTKPELCA
jgi:hypothetical protein